MEHELVLTPTLCAIEADVDDVIQVRMPDGTQRRITVKLAKSHVVRRGPLPYADKQGVVLYGIRCTLEIDGHTVQLARNIPSQENFRDPPCIMGLRIWLDATGDISEFLTSHGSTECFPKRAVRLAIWDANQRICPPLVHPWCPLPEDGLRIEECYRGEDTWCGPYDGSECHGGLDINHPAGTPLWTPISIHEHELFGRVDVNANNNRWRGLHHWPDGKTWILQAHHMVRLLVDEVQPLEAGTHYAEAAGVLSGSHEHSHFVFGIRTGDQELFIDPWLLFWQMYRDRAATVRP